MYPNIPSPITPEVQRAINSANANRQKVINAAAIQEGSTAECVAKNLFEQIIDYQSKLSDEDDVAISIVQFNQSTTILVDSIGYSGYNLVYFEGKDGCGKPVKLIQHIQQLNFLLMVVPKPEPSEPKRKIGFAVSED